MDEAGGKALVIVRATLARKVEPGVRTDRAAWTALAMTWIGFAGATFRFDSSHIAINLFVH